MDTSFKIPFYAKVAFIFISMIALVFTMYIGQHIIVPLLYATIFAILLNPLVNYLIRKKVNKIVSISAVVVLAIFVASVFFYIVSSQITIVGETYPQLEIKIDKTTTQLVHWMSRKFDVRESKLNLWIRDAKNETMNNLAIGERLTEAGRMVVTCVLLPVYLFLLLFYKPLLLEFIRKIFHTEHHIVVVEVLVKSKRVIQHYLVGLFFEMIIIAVLNSVGLLLLGIDYAIFLGISGAILNIIPYFGGIIAIALPMIIAYVTKDSYTYAVLVFVVYIVIQFIDNHYIIPYIVASRVKINALVSIIVVLIGGAIWGIPGMFLSIPLVGIIKVIFDHIEPLKPWGFLLGNIVPTAPKLSFIKQKKAINSYSKYNS
jgi:predicted PurR-regulated permease PerM